MTSEFAGGLISEYRAVLASLKSRKARQLLPSLMTRWDSLMLTVHDA
jgi:hypothetical protein